MGTERQIVQLVRGKDVHGNFEIVDPPGDDESSIEVRKVAERRMLKNVYSSAKPN